MHSIYTFEPVARYSNRYPVPALRIHAHTACGQGFDNIGAILEPDSENPALMQEPTPGHQAGLFGPPGPYGA